MAIDATAAPLPTTAGLTGGRGRGLLDVPTLHALGRRSDARGAAQAALHLAFMGTTGALVHLAMPWWLLLVPAMALHGVTIVAMFAPMHECVHRTAFASRRANDTVGWVAGVLGFYNATFYRHFHAWHHRYTQDPARDPELMYPKAASRLSYLVEISAAMFWWRRIVDYPRLAVGAARKLPFVPPSARRAVALSMSAQLAVYAGALAAVGVGYMAPLYYWFLPAVLAQPLLRAVLIVEHSGCSNDDNGLTDTRTTLTAWPIRLLMWNMPYHAEHHLYPAVPFHQLPEMHRRIGDRLAHVAPGYLAANREIVAGLPRG
jgi:fatty acid desaturase